MKRFILIFLFPFIGISLISHGQELVLDFEGFGLQPDTFLNGSDLSGAFYEPIFSGGDSFRLENYYDTAFGGYWAGGYAISSMRDDSTAGPSNLYSAITGGGQASSTYGIVNASSAARLNIGAPFDEAWIFEPRYMGVYLTNSTYAYHSMLQGDGFAKKFGGSTGDDPDYFFIRFYFSDNFNNSNPYDSLDFYLADFRSANNAEDYIIDDWVYLDLNDYPAFEYFGRTMDVKLFSSDTSAFGINTPTFFCMDNLEIAYPTGVVEQQEAPSWSVKVMQSSLDAISDEAGDFELISLSGNKVAHASNQRQVSFDTAELPQGIYILTYFNGTTSQSQKVWRW